MVQHTLYRFWCKTCQDYTLQDDSKCLTCETESVEYSLSDVPEEKIAEQRKRYTDKRKQSIYETAFGRQNIVEELFRENPKTVIVETDAGLVRERKIQADKDEKIHQQIQEEKDIYNTFFKHLQRNDLCGCDSGKKYKKCCQPKYVSAKF